MEGRRTADEPGPVLRAEGDLDGARHMFEASLRISRRNGDRRGIAYDCLYLACLAGDMGDWDRAGVLHGFAQVFQDRAGIPRDEFDERYRQDSLAQARARAAGASTGTGAQLVADQTCVLDNGSPVIPCGAPDPREGKHEHTRKVLLALALAAALLAGSAGMASASPAAASAVATHGGRRYFSRLAFRFTWRGHTYAGTERFADPCGNTTGCWVTPGTPVE